MKIAILTANLGNFDTPVDPMVQDWDRSEIAFYRFTDENFPPITGMTPRMQYRLCKLFGFEMFPGYDAYIWLDGTFSLPRTDSVRWFVDQLGDADAAFFKHPARNSIQEEVKHIEDHLQKGRPYITSRYKNGLHKEMNNLIQQIEAFRDNKLYTSTAFIYRRNFVTKRLMQCWQLWQSRFPTCDQVSLPYAIYKMEDYGLRINTIDVDQYKTPYLKLVSHHK